MYSTPEVSTWWKHLFQQWLLWVFWGEVSTSFGQWDGEIFAHYSRENRSSSAKFDGDRWWTAIFKSCHKCSIAFKSGLSLGPLKNIYFLLIQPLQCSFSFVLQIIVLLKFVSPTQFQIHGWIKQIFIKDSPLLCTVHCPFYPDKLASPADEKQPHNMIPPQPCLTVRMVLTRWCAVLGLLQM